MVVNWWWLALSIVMFICFICCYPFNIRQINEQFKNACFWTWYMKKDNETLTDEDIMNLNWREWNNIYNNISCCWILGSGFLALAVVLFLMSMGIIG